MYTPAHFAETDELAALDRARSVGFGHLVCTSGGALTSIPLPFVIDDGATAVRFHVARANPIWRTAPVSGLLIVAGLDGYVSPSWYPTKADHGKVVPTWNYEVVHLHGHLTLCDQPDWVRTQVGDLTEHNEAEFSSPWAVDDAPDDFVAKQLRAIVGLELEIERIEAKSKLSQNRSEADRAGVAVGLEGVGAQSLATAVEQAN